MAGDYISSARFRERFERQPHQRFSEHDGRHPSLAARIFFAALYDQTAGGLSYDAGLGADAVLYLQQVARKKVQDHAGR